MTFFHVKTSFQPLRLTAFIRNDVETKIEVENLTDELLWVEAEVVVPESISLLMMKDLARAKKRIGIIPGKMKRDASFRIYASAKSHADNYPVKLILYGFDRNGDLFGREEKVVELRCERIGSQ